MNTIRNSLVLGACFVAAMGVAVAPEAPLTVTFFRDATARLVVAPVRRTAVVTSVAVASSTANANAAAQANANAAAQANAQAAQANAAAANANAAAAAGKAAGAPAVGTVVTTLPPGCAQDKLNGVDYMRCGSTYYKPSMLGSNLVFVVAQP